MEQLTCGNTIAMKCIQNTLTVKKEPGAAHEEWYRGATRIIGQQSHLHPLHEKRCQLDSPWSDEVQLRSGQVVRIHELGGEGGDEEGVELWFSEQVGLLHDVAEHSGHQQQVLGHVGGLQPTMQSS